MQYKNKASYFFCLKEDEKNAGNSCVRYKVNKVVIKKELD